LQEKGKAMEKKTIFGLAGSLLMTLTGCQSSDPGPGSGLMSRQSTDAFAKPSMNSMASTMPGNKSLGITDTNSRPGMMPGTNNVQQAGAMQTTTSASAGFNSTAPSNTSVPGFDRAGEVVSRPMGDAGNPAGSSAPMPPPPPSGYTIPQPNPYTPSTNSAVPTRKPGDDM
jgi:hypothetical protein